MKKWLLTGVFLLALVLAACGGNNNAGKTTKMNAEELYASNCASCHGQDLAGGSAPDLRNIGSKLSKEEIKTKIEKGGGGMPGGLVSGEDLEKLTDWLAAKK